MHPSLAWRDGALERSRTPFRLQRDYWLDGHGLQILPSVLWTGPPLFSIRPHELGGSAVIYPARAAVGRQGVREPQALAALIGRTRATVLNALREPCSTAELAGRAGIRAPSASEHAAVLRDADLIQTIRCGRGVQHSLTPLGRSLLSASHAGERADGPSGTVEPTSATPPGRDARAIAASPAPSRWRARAAASPRP